MKGVAVLLLVVYAASVYARSPASRITVVPVEECPKDQIEDWTIEWLMRHEDCNKFYKCAFGYPVEYKCYGDLYFNLETWQCDWQENVDCEDRNIPTPEPETTTTPSTTTSPTTTPTTTTPTTTTPTTTTPTTTTPTTTTPTTTTTTTTTTTPAPTTTTTTTTTPAPTTTTTTTTPAPTTTTTTTTPAPTTTTTTTTPAPTTTTTTPAPTTTSTTTTQAPTTEDKDIEFLENGCPVDYHVHWLLAHEDTCNLFYYCVFGDKVLRECPADLHFNTVLQVCDWPVNAGCTLPNSHSNEHGIVNWFRNLL